MVLPHLLVQSLLLLNLVLVQTLKRAKVRKQTPVAVLKAVAAADAGAPAAELRGHVAEGPHHPVRHPRPAAVHRAGCAAGCVDAQR